VPDSNCKAMPRLLLFSAGLLFLCATELGAQANTPSSPASPPMHEVTDGYGRTVSIPKNPLRIVSLAPSLTETIYVLGVEDRLVGDTDYCEYPPEAKKKPKVGGVLNPNMEVIVALHPDLVLVTKEGNRIETLRSLESLGIPTYATDAHSVDEIIASTQRLADLLGVSDAGKVLAEGLQQRLSKLQAKLSTVPARRVLFIVWPEPLTSIGKNTFIADALRRAGASSIVDSNRDWPQLDLEEVARLQPEYLVFAPSHSDSGTYDFEALANRPGWRILDAVRNHHFAMISDAIDRPSPGIVSVIENLARELHPEVFMETRQSEKPVSREISRGPDLPHQSSFSPVVFACLPESSCAR